MLLGTDRYVSYLHSQGTTEIVEMTPSRFLLHSITSAKLIGAFPYLIVSSIEEVAKSNGVPTGIPAAPSSAVLVRI